MSWVSTGAMAAAGSYAREHGFELRIEQDGVRISKGVYDAWVRWDDTDVEHNALILAMEQMNQGTLP